MKAGPYRSCAMLLLAALAAGCAAPFPVGPDYRGPSAEAAPPAPSSGAAAPKSSCTASSRAASNAAASAGVGGATK